MMQKNKIIKNKKTQHIPKTMSQSIPYELVYASGIMEISPNEFSKSYYIPEVNFKTANNENQANIAETYSNFIGSFDPSIRVEITIYNKTIDIMEFQENVMIPYSSDNLNKYRDEYNQMLIQKMAGAKNNLETVKLLTLSLHADNIEEATQRFSQLDNTVIEGMADMTKRNTEPLTYLDRLEILNSIYNQDASSPLYQKRTICGREVESFSLENCAEQGITTKDVIAPEGMAFSSDKSAFGNTIAKTYYVSNYPTWIKGTFLTSLSSLPINMLVSAYFKCIPQEEAIKLIRRKRTNIASALVDIQKKAYRGGFDPSLISPDTQTAKDETTEMMDDMTKANVRLFTATIVITLFAPNEEKMTEYEKLLKAEASKALCSVKLLKYQQEQGFNSSLPLGNLQINAERLMTSNTIASIIPFSVREVRQKTGKYYGLNAASGNMILYDRTTDLNPNGCILGMPGSGKSFAAKREILNILLSTDDEVYIIDPEGIDYSPMAEAMGGSVIKLAAGSNLFLNPFDLNIENTDDNNNPVKVKADFIETICEIAVGGKYGLSPVEKTMIGRAIMGIYTDYMKHLKMVGKSIDIEAAPTMLDFYNQLLAQQNIEAQNIALSLERYVKGAFDIFSHRTNVEINNRFTVYNIKEIGAGLKELGLHICLDHIWNKMISNKEKGKRTWFYIDEFYLLMQKPTSSAYIAEIWKRARKWDGVPTAITQNVEDLLKNEDARTIINNSSFCILLGQAPMNKKQLSAMLNISPEEQKYISSLKPGMGLIRIGDDIIPMNDSFPKNTELYRLMTTKPDETRKIA